MTPKCLLCGKLTAAVSYHAFPKDVTVLAKWKEFCLSANIKETLLDKTNYLCSSHFLGEDYLHPVGRVRNKLRWGAVPSVHCSTNGKRNYTQIEEVAEDNCVSKYPKIEDRRELENAERECSSTRSAAAPDTSIDGINDDEGRELDNVERECSSTRSAAAPDTSIDEINDVVMEDGDEIPPVAPPSHGNSTVDGDVTPPNVSACSNFEDNIITGKSTSVKPSDQNPFFKEARYVGDIKSSHLATPHEAKKAITLAKITIARQKSKILNLQQTTRRLKQRIVTLKGLVQNLKQKNKKCNR